MIFATNNRLLFQFNFQLLMDLSNNQLLIVRGLKKKNILKFTEGPQRIKPPFITHLISLFS